MLTKDALKTVEVYKLCVKSKHINLVVFLI